ncbi:MAG: hypothetical protein ACOX46_07280 [Limnochordia bacterium]|nr:hypothetical protein [Bacillota bacterium]
MQPWVRSLCVLGLIAFAFLAVSTTAAAFEAEDLPFGFGPQGWQTGLGLSQESVKSKGLLGYEKTGIDGYLTHGEGDQEAFSWFSGRKQVIMGNIGYSLELFGGNTQRPILSTFLSSTEPHVGAYGEFSRMYGTIGHGLAGEAQFSVSEVGEFQYSIIPYVQFQRQGVWRFSLSLGSSFGFGMSYQEPQEKVKLDITVVGEGLSMHVLLSLSEHPLTLGAGLTQEQAQVFIRYSF